MTDLLFLPIDLPRFPVDKLSTDTESEWMFWKLKKLTEERSSPYDETLLKTDVPSEISEWVHLLPYKTIRNVKFNIQQSAVMPHMDFTNPDGNRELHQNNTENEPCGFRVLLKGSKQNKLYVIKSNGEKFYPQIAEDTDTYVLRHTNGMHGVEFEEDRHTLFLHFEIDAVKHKELIERSLSKYGEYAVWDK